MTDSAKRLYLKENRQKVYKDQLESILNEALKVSKNYIRIRWDDIWPKLQSDFKKQSEFTRPRDTFKKDGIVNIEIDHVDFTLLNSLLRNGEHSPLKSKSPPQKPPSVYNSVWKNPDKDIADKLQQLRQFLRSNWPESDNESDELKKDIATILKLSDGQFLQKTLNSYLWLLQNEENYTESLLSAHLSPFGVEGFFGALNLISKDFDVNDYSFVIYMVVLLDQRNTIVHFTEDEFVPLYSYNKHYDVIKDCIYNMLRLMSNVCQEEEKARRVNDIKQEVLTKIEQIVRQASYDSETVTVFREEIAKDNVQSRPATGVPVPKAENRDNCSGPSGGNGGATNGGILCQLCQKMVPGLSEMKLHEQGKASLGRHHQNRLKQFNNSASSVPPPPHPVETAPKNLSESELDEKRKQALDDLLPRFIESFDPRPKATSLLRGLKVFSELDDQKICIRDYQEERVVEFIDRIKGKQDWYKHLTTVLNQYNKDLLDLLQKRVDQI